MKHMIPPSLLDETHPCGGIGGRTRTRTLDPLIKNYTVHVDYQQVKEYFIDPVYNFWNILNGEI
ncbi:MAG: hypothetical protein WAK85_18780, partial [Xanthobacteraceae bacterium]